MKDLKEDLTCEALDLVSGQLSRQMHIYLVQREVTARNVRTNTNNSNTTEATTSQGPVTSSLAQRAQWPKRCIKHNYNGQSSTWNTWPSSLDTCNHPLPKHGEQAVPLKTWPGGLATLRLINRFYWTLYYTAPLSKRKNIGVLKFSEPKRVLLFSPWR